MIIEVERKYRRAEYASLRRRLDDLGAELTGTVEHEDVYLKHPSRDFMATGEALRVRRVGKLYYLTYKGPKQTGTAKIREELEVPMSLEFGQADKLELLWNRLGFEPVARIQKTRTTYVMKIGIQEAQICLDRVQGLGSFVEIEVLANSREELDTAQEAVAELSQILGVKQSDLEPRSYLTMLLEKHAPRTSVQVKDR